MQQPVCTTFASCCDLCGADSIRCARGPASQTFWSKSFFNFSLPLDNVGFWDVAFSFYGMVPYLAVIFAVGHLLVTWAIKRDRSVVLKWGIRKLVWCFAVACDFIRAVGTKILGDCKQCYRPCGSTAAGVYGLPSGHSMTSIGLCVWLLLEIWFGIRTTRWPKPKQIAISSSLVLAFVPVPYSRVYLGDHTHLQVAVGSTLGLVLGVTYFLLVRHLILRRDDLLACRGITADDHVVVVTAISMSSLQYEAGPIRVYRELHPQASAYVATCGTI